MKRNRVGIIMLIAILIILIIFLLGVMWTGISGGSFFNFNTFSHVSDELILEREYDDNFDKIILGIDAGEIDIKESDNDQVKVLIYGDKDRLKYSDSGKLDIKYTEKSCIGFCFNRQMSKIEIFLPSDYSGKIEIDSDYGNISVGEFASANIDIKANFGNTNIDKVDRLNVENDAGNVEIGEVNTIIGELDFGKLKIDRVNKKIEVENNCGDIDIDELLITENSKIEVDMGSLKIGKTSDIYIDASVDMGSQKIGTNNSKSDITLKANVDCGDLKINN